MNTETETTLAATVAPAIVIPSSVELMTKEELRIFISGNLKKIAAVKSGAEFPTSTAIQAVCAEFGYESVADMTAYARIPEMKEIAARIMAHPLWAGPAPSPACENKDAEQAEPAMTKSKVSVMVADEIEPAAETPDPSSRVPVDEDDALTKALAETERQMAKLREAAAKRAGSVPPDLMSRIEGMDKRLDAHHSVIKVVTKDVADCNAEVGRLKPVIDAIMAALPASTPPPPRVVAAVAAAVSPTKDRMLEAVRPFFTPGLEQTCAIPAVVSPPSFGKTYMADSIAGLYEASFLHPFKDDIDEISALVGTVTPRPDGTLLTADGPLTAAIRSAQAGTKTLFIGDEIFNATRKTLEWMLSTLSPRVHDGKRCYILQTRQVEEDGTFEILRAPVENLHILFMGNLRASPPEAFASRIQLLRFDFSKEWAQEVCLQRLEYFSGGLFNEKVPAVRTWAEKFALLMEATRARYSTLELARPLCFRFLIAAVQNVCRWESSPEVKHLTAYFEKYLPQQIAVQNAATQDTDPASHKVAESLLVLIK